ncbi:uncharacterized protein [Nicotiana tomentosiformis]|uniref:uncharacterized protein isoform X1 n=1 Tax=Nicotiana tomentosiformis TaxID=4098 RepID=UPI00087894B7|nr:uncharacterized protein LOC104106079 [Nicotiana tomentosiformis]
MSVYCDASEDPHAHLIDLSEDPHARPEQEGKLIEVLRKHKRTLGWTIADIKGISPTICMHRILMENEYKPIVQPQRRLNPAMQEVVKKEVVKLLAADGMIQRCVPEIEINNILSHCHDGAVGGHYEGRITAAKVLEAGVTTFCCPMLTCWSSCNS